MTETDHTTTFNGAWAPLPVDPGLPGGRVATVPEGAVLRSPAAPVVATEDLYRPNSSEPDLPGSGPTAAPGHYPAPAVTEVVDPFYLPGPDGPLPGDNAGMKTWGVVLVDVLATTIAAIVDLRLNLHLTWITGAVFVTVCVITAIAVRRRDLSIAVITPPLAFVFAVAVAAVTSSVGEAGSMMIRMSRDIFASLAFNAPFVFAGTGLALIIVAIRALRRPRA